jgi:D-alanyl-D-alanine carboxypeptidase (penicillin-binding protein 5/6)
VLRRTAAGVVALLLLAGGPGAWAATPAPPVLHARAAAVYDATAGRFLWMLNGDRELPMASLTKMMTALVALRDLHEDTATVMTVPPEVKRVYGEVIYLTPGETYTFGELLDALLLESANDAAVTIAVNAAGSEQAFVAQMNDAAAALGLSETHFVNAHGLDAPGHYSSAHDLALLGAAAMQDPVFRAVVGTRRATIPWPEKNSVRTLTNQNLLLAGFPGANGIKTGYTSEALNCVVGSAEADGREMIAVVMGEPRTWEWRDESDLLRYGLDTAPTLPLPPRPEAAAAPVHASAAFAGAVRSPQAARRPGSWPWLAALLGGGAFAAALRSRRPARPRRWRWHPARFGR